MSRHPWRTYGVITLVVLAIAGPALYVIYQREVRSTEAILGAMVEVEASQVEQWARERYAHVVAIAQSSPLAALYARWVRDGDGAAWEDLVQRLDHQARTSGLGAMALVSSEHEILWSSDERDHARMPESLEAMWPDGPVRGDVRYAGVELDDEGVVHTHIVGVLAVPEEVEPPLIIGHIDLEDLLPFDIRAWPLPNRTGEVLVEAHLDDRVLVLRANDANGGPREVLHLDPDQRWDVIHVHDFAAMEGAGTVHVRGLDFDGARVWAAARQVGDTNWHLLVKVDESEILAARMPVFAVSGVASVLLLTVGTLFAWAGRQREVQVSEHVQHAADQARLGTLALLESIGRSAVDAISAKDLEGRFLFVNDAASRLVGRSRDEMLGRTDLELLPEAQARQVMREEAQVVEAGVPMRVERLMRAPEVERTFLADIAPLRDADGNVLGVVSISRDVTERVEAQAELRKLSTAIEQSPESIVITDRDGTIEYVNQAFVEQTGFAREEAIGGNPRILNSGKTPASTYEDMWRTLESGAIWRGEFINRRKDGRDFIEEAIIAPLVDEGGTTAHYLAIKADVTDRKRLEGELDAYRHHLEDLVTARTQELSEARERADAANAAKSAFLANMSHEIRTPLNAILGLTHLGLEDSTNPEGRAQIEKVRTSAQHLLSIVNNVLDLAKIEANRLTLETLDVDLERLIQDVVDMTQPSADAKGLRLTTDLSGAPAWVRTDPARLRQALLNLLSNSVKFTEEGGVHLLAQTVTPSGETGSRLRISVADSGVGMTSEQLARVLDPFEQADVSTTRRYGGTGLGLTITRRLAHAMGGDLAVRSAPGEGTTMTLELPLALGSAVGTRPPPAARRIDAATLAETAGGKHVLLVEDEPISREVAVEILKRAGLDVHAANTGREALDYATEHHLDVIVADVRTPDMDGLEATRRIRMLDHHRNTPILAFSANTREEDRDACLAAGMNELIPKPIDPPALYAILQHYLSPDVSAASPPTRQPRAPSAAPMPATGGDAARSPEPREPIERSGPLDALRSFDGVDVAAGLASLGGDADRYLRLLARFLIARRDDAQQIRRHLSHGDEAAALECAHALKGVAGTLGLTQLQATAATIEAHLQAGTSTTPLATIESLLVTLASDLDALASLVPDHGRGYAAEHEVGALEGKRDQERTVGQLVALVEQDNVRALALLESHEVSLSGEFGRETVRAVREAVERFDFEAARAVLRSASGSASPFVGT